MGIALFTLSAFFAPRQTVANRLASARTHSTRTATGPASGPESAPRRPVSHPSAAVIAAATRPPTPLRHIEQDSVLRRSPTLRVVRNIEAGIPVGSSGRMVISGRMADVCAELDRLAAIEGSRKASTQ
jgi:hypothetical protein